MIHNENHPDPQNTAEWDQTHAELRNTLDRLRNPPWWDLPQRAANRSLRLERAYIDDDPKGARWVRWSGPLRMVLTLALIITVSFQLQPGYLSTVVNIAVAWTLAYWPLALWQRAVVYQRAYERGQRDAFAEARDMMREGRD